MIVDLLPLGAIDLKVKVALPDAYGRPPKQVPYQTKVRQLCSMSLLTIVEQPNWRVSMRMMIVVCLFLTASGCASMKIAPLTQGKAGQAHENDSPVKSGYIVYAPMVLFEIKAGEHGGCVVGPTFTLPDYSKPYVIDSRSGFGKAGSEFTIADGWRLSTMKDSSDNSAFLALATKSLELRPDVANSCGNAGVYRIQSGGTSGFSIAKFDIPTGH